jgi:hypothetical protein
MKLHHILPALALAGSVASATPALAHQWYLFNFSMSQCEDAQFLLPVAASPFNWEMTARSSGHFMARQVSRDHDGNIIAVWEETNLGAGGSASWMVWFPTLAICQWFAATQPHPSDLN